MGLTGPTSQPTQGGCIFLRKSTLIVALAAALIALCLAHPSISPAGLAPSKPTKLGKVSRNSCAGHRITVQAAGPFIEKVWELVRWQREKPKPTTVRAYRNKLRCMGPGNRKAAKHRWRGDKRAFYKHRREQLAEQRYYRAITPPGASVLAAIRTCESGGNYSTNTGNGFYGAYQFLASTWASVGGSGLPHEASSREQDERAAYLYRLSGSSPWPVCGV